MQHRQNSLSIIEAKMCAESWHPLALFSMGTARIPEADDWPQRGSKRTADVGLAAPSSSL